MSVCFGHRLKRQPMFGNPSWLTLEASRERLLAGTVKNVHYCRVHSAVGNSLCGLGVSFCPVAVSPDISILSQIATG